MADEVFANMDCARLGISRVSMESDADIAPLTRLATFDLQGQVVMSDHGGNHVKRRLYKLDCQVEVLGNTVVHIPPCPQLFAQRSFPAVLRHVCPHWPALIPNCSTSAFLLPHLEYTTKQCEDLLTLDPHQPFDCLLTLTHWPIKPRGLLGNSVWVYGRNSLWHHLASSL